MFLRIYILIEMYLILIRQTTVNNFMRNHYTLYLSYTSYIFI